MLMCYVWCVIIVVGFMQLLSIVEERITLWVDITFSADMLWYIKLSNNIQWQQAIISMHFIVLVAAYCENDYLYNPYSHSCLQLITFYQSWNSSRSYCTSRRERLATFESLESAYWLIHIRKTHSGENQVECLQVNKLGVKKVNQPNYAV